MADPKDRRVFWLGMHVVLTRTELPRLRALGYEVFNPPYHARVYDQSANTDWDRSQPTTLPPAVFAELARYNFFYNRISPRVAGLLNEHFGTVIVTINPDWLLQVLKVYRGKVIYRTFGQTGTLAEALWARRCFRLVAERDDFWFVPHAEEAVADEHAWLRERMEVVPYTLAPDVFEHRDTWDPDGPHRREVMVTCPNIANHYYAGHYRYLNEHFPEDFLRLYGVQPGPVADPRVCGTLTREELMQRYRAAAGYLYTYRDPHVCYLPPIEMMTVGGPVLYLPGSLLARYFGAGSAGLAVDEADARRKMNWLLSGDRSFLEDVLAAQEGVRRRYAPEHVHPRFDATFSRLLAPAARSPAAPVLHDPRRPAAAARGKRVYVLFHFDSRLVEFKDGEYSATEGIPRVMERLVRGVLERTDYQVTVTCTAEQLPLAFGLFRRPEDAGRVTFLVLDPGKLTRNWRGRAVGFLRRKARQLGSHRKAAPGHPAGGDRPGPAGGVHRRLARAFYAFRDSILLSARFPARLLGGGWAGRILLACGSLLAVGLYAAYALGKLAARLGGTVLQWARHDLVANGVRLVRILRSTADRLRGVAAINRDPDAVCVVVPHYYLFPEGGRLRPPALLYLPDYMPHFVEGEFDGNHKVNAGIGARLARRAATVFTCSEFSKGYLPETVLRVDADKIRVLPIPLLMPKRRPLDPARAAALRAALGDAPYVFYPTQNRPNKQLAFLLEVFHAVRARYAGLKLVLTCDLEHHPPVARAHRRLGLDRDVVLLRGVSDSELSWLYRHAAALCLTSTMEGNFPPQVFEALESGTPLVATRLPLITEVLRGSSDLLLLCEPLDLGDFTEKLARALADPDGVRDRQRAAYQIVLDHANDAAFADAMAGLVHNLAS